MNARNHNYMKIMQTKIWQTCLQWYFKYMHNNMTIIYTNIWHMTKMFTIVNDNNSHNNVTNIYMTSMCTILWKTCTQRYDKHVYKNMKKMCPMIWQTCTQLYDIHVHNYLINIYTKKWQTCTQLENNHVHNDMTRL